MLQPRHPAGAPGLEIALGWHIVAANGQTIVWHNGGTGGYRTFMGFDPEARTGVVVLANASSPAGPDDIGRHLLDPKSPLLAASSPSTRAAEVADRDCTRLRRCSTATSVVINSRRQRF